ncbi:MAG: TatD family hydrolase [Phycisphaerae bacterium]
MLIDTHCHLAHGKLFGRVADLLEEARQAGVGHVICAAGDLHESKTALGLTAKYGTVHSMAGIHPHEARHADENALSQVADLAGKDKVVAIGEIGLDYHYDFSPVEDQKHAFIRQLQLARQLHCPVVIHTREAFEDTLAILDESGMDWTRVLMHSFTGEPEQTRRLLDRGAMISYSGIATFNSAREIRQSVEMTPTDRILVETDAPFLSPEPVRKIHPNVPAHVVHTARRVANILGIDEEQLAAETTANAIRFFSLPIEQEA